MISTRMISKEEAAVLIGAIDAYGQAREDLALKNEGARDFIKVYYALLSQFETSTGWHPEHLDRRCQDIRRRARKGKTCSRQLR